MNKEIRLQCSADLLLKWVYYSKGNDAFHQDYRHVQGPVRSSATKARTGLKESRLKSVYDTFFSGECLKYRSSEIIAQILVAAKEIEGVTKTKIMFQAFVMV